MRNLIPQPTSFCDFRVSVVEPATLLIRLKGGIDGQTVDDLRRAIERAPATAREVTLDCGGLTGIDPVGAARLWLLCMSAPRSFGRSVSLSHFPTALARQLRLHPLLSFAPSEDAIFQDPFARMAPSER